MSEPKPMASLSSGLLARKGDARPAMRRAYVPVTSVASLPVSLQSEGAYEELQDDLGWNDMGADVPAPAPAAPAPVVAKQQQRIMQSFAKAKSVKKVVKERAQPRKAKTAFTLRLDAERHLRLRLGCALSNRSAQHIVTQALDEFLENQPGLAAMLAQAPKNAAQN